MATLEKGGGCYAAGSKNYLNLMGDDWRKCEPRARTPGLLFFCLHSPRMLCKVFIIRGMEVIFASTLLPLCLHCFHNPSSYFYLVGSGGCGGNVEVNAPCLHRFSPW